MNVGTIHIRDDTDRLDFLQRLSKGIAKSGALCYTWALMTNHLHLLILAGAKGLAALMQPLLTGYVGAFNRRHHRVGHLVQNRFKAILCEEDPYLLELIRYIPLNPVRTRIVRTPAELARYPWTGHASILGEQTTPWQCTDHVLALFGSDTAVARKAYENFVIDRWTQGVRKDLEGGGLLRSLGGLAGVAQARATGTYQAFDARILGSGDFVEAIQREADQYDAERHRAAAMGLTLDALQEKTAEMTGVSTEALFRRDRSRPVTEARALFIYAATEILGVTAARLGNLLRLSSGSVSEARQRGRLLDDQRGFLETLLENTPSIPVARIAELRGPSPKGIRRFISDWVTP